MSDINKQIRAEINSNQKSNELVDKMLEVQSDNPLERSKTVISDYNEENEDEELTEMDWLTNEDLEDIDLLDNDLDPRNEY